MLKIFVILFSTAYATTFNQVTELINKRHKTLGNNTVKFFKEVKTELNHHLIIKFNDSNNTYYDIDILVNVSPTKAEELKETQKKILYLLYSDKPSPYAGMLSNNLKCSSHSNPQLQSVKIYDKKVSVYVSMAGKDYQLGVCNKDDFHFWVCSAFHFDGKNLHLIKNYSNKTNKSVCLKNISTYIKDYE